jgi:8-oxo-dGTP diphosphatase
VSSRPLAEGGEVWAAGGIVVRWEDGSPRLALVHRASRDDWTFPKGHLEDGETAADAARREVEEETALSCRLLRHAGRSRYLDHRGRPKVVDYWVMEVAGGEFVANDEVDELRWMDVDGARSQLTYEADRSLLESLGDLTRR